MTLRISAMDSLTAPDFNGVHERNHPTPEAPTLVLGGTGKTGRRVAERLMARGVPTRIASRTGDTPFDWEDRQTWAPALQGAGSVYVSYYPDRAVPGAVDAVGALAELAVAGGVRRLVLLAGRNAHLADGVQRALVREPRDFADYVRDTAATGVWTPSAGR